LSDQENTWNTYVKVVKRTDRYQPLGCRWFNPFSDESQPLASISTSAVPSLDIALDLAKAYLSGEAAYQGFKNNRLEPDKRLVKFHGTLKKQSI